MLTAKPGSINGMDQVRSINDLPARNLQQGSNLVTLRGHIGISPTECMIVS